MKEMARRLTLAIYNIDKTYVTNEKKKRMSRAELNFMYALDDGKWHSQAEICRDWQVPKTTLSTIVKRWKKLEYLRQEVILENRREKQLILTEQGKQYVSAAMKNLYHAESNALSATIAQYSDEFIEVLEFFGKALRDSFETEDTYEI